MGRGLATAVHPFPDVKCKEGTTRPFVASVIILRVGFADTSRIVRIRKNAINGEAIKGGVRRVNLADALVFVVHTSFLPESVHLQTLVSPLQAQPLTNVKVHTAPGNPWL